MPHFAVFLALRRFNTQPPKGGWTTGENNVSSHNSFNTQPPKGGWIVDEHEENILGVSTHSRLKAAGPAKPTIIQPIAVSTHSRLKAAG